MLDAHLYIFLLLGFWFRMLDGFRVAVVRIAFGKIDDLPNQYLSNQSRYATEHKELVLELLPFFINRDGDLRCYYEYLLTRTLQST